MKENKNIKITIITINYNNYTGLKETIESVIIQSYKNLEYIIIDGDSTDGSKDLLLEYSNKISFFKSEPDNGIYNAMNKGIIRATGEYLLFLNSGDILNNKFAIEKIANRITNEDLIMGRILCIPSNRVAYTELHQDITMFDFFINCPIPHPACLIKKELLIKYPYDENLKLVSDWKFFIQCIIFENCKFTIIDDIITNFKEGGASSNKMRCENERKKVLNELIPKRIRMDYLRLQNGEKFVECDFNNFFSDLRKFNPKCSVLIYKINYIIIICLSLFFKSLRFINSYSFNPKMK